MNLATTRNLFRPLTGLAITVSLLSVPLATAAAAGATTVPSAHAVAPLENRFCDSESGYDCLSYGYAPDNESGFGHGGSALHNR